LADLNFEYLKIYFDGGSRNNPGPSAVGVVIFDKNNNRVDEISEYIGIQTNNFAEYSAFDRALDMSGRFRTKYKISRIILFTDSKLLYNQVRGFWKIKDSDLAGIHKKIIKKLKEYDTVDLRLVPRQENREADRLVNIALDSRNQGSGESGQFKLYPNGAEGNGVKFGKIED
jgi:ribonuclease HI